VGEIIFCHQFSPALVIILHDKFQLGFIEIDNKQTPPAVTVVLLVNHTAHLPLIDTVYIHINSIN
jgi:hypothetical protein